MKIYSSFSDFYDCVEFITPSSKKDPKDVSFRRVTSEYEIPLSYERLNEFRSSRYDLFELRNSLVSFIPLFFCGEYIPIPRVGNTTFATFEKAAEYANENERNPRIRDANYSFIKKIDKTGANYKKLIGCDSLDFYTAINAPYFIIEPLVYGSNSAKIIINPPLFEIGFAKIKDPYTTFQSIEMFFNSVLINNSDKDIPQITDNKVICEAKGFDSKMSFRKRKKT